MLNVVYLWMDFWIVRERYFSKMATCPVITQKCKAKIL